MTGQNKWSKICRPEGAPTAARERFSRLSDAAAAARQGGSSAVGQDRGSGGDDPMNRVNFTFPNPMTGA